jgi:hypothetical protein
MATADQRADIQICERTHLLGTSCLRKIGITSAMIEHRAKFMLISKLIKWPFNLPITPIYSAQLCFLSHQIWPFNLYFWKCIILFFLIYYVHLNFNDTKSCAISALKDMIGLKVTTGVVTCMYDNFWWLGCVLGAGIAESI